MYKKAFFAALLGVFFYANTSIAAEPEKIVKNTVINLNKINIYLKYLVCFSTLYIYLIKRNIKTKTIIIDI